MILSADHVNLQVRDLAASVAFYEALGLTATPIPGMEDRPGRWLRDPAGNPIVHIGEVGLAGGSSPGGPGTGAVHHVAFNCADYEAARAQLEQAGHALTLNEVPAADLGQIFVRDPDGVLIELNFRGR